MRTQRLYVDGAWLDGNGTLEVRSPWDRSVVGTVAVATREQVDLAVQAAHRALQEPLPPYERAAILHRATALLEQRRDEFAETLLREAGKPRKAAEAELHRAILTLRWAAEEAARLPGETVPMDAVASGADTIGFTLPEPVGVVAAITPFNFPVNLVLHKIAPAVAAGCPVVLKPSEKTPLSAGLLVEVFEQAGLPAGLLNLVTGDPAQIVAALNDSPLVTLVTFTGSSRVGWQLKAASPTKRHVLELGSNTAMVVMPSADLGAAASAVVSAGFAFSGQACVSLQRLYVHTEVVDDLVAQIRAAMTGLTVGDPGDPATDIGPLITPESTERVRGWLADAEAAGAKILAGGGVVDGVLEPTVITGVAPQSPLICEEVFGPVVTLVPVASLGEALTAVNSSRFGLNTAIYSNDLREVRRYVSQAQAGTVLVNRPAAYRSDHMPYGGVKESGEGREGIRYAIEAMLHQKLVVLG
ncbi:aldehyde dehydrogenase family protein [Micromonospora sp. NPDC051296]|uniref:aldehyde dehydrogenase family protein n=1 Tax=Micromonospora sp. NPDC051296 TaxID=3155046 RepID=UPI00343AC18E